MTHEEEIADLKSRIASQERNHKTRSGLYRRLCKIRLSELEDEMSSKHAVDQAIYALRMAIYDLQNLRMANDTADQVLIECPMVTSCAAWLNDLSDDIRKAVFNSHVVDLRDKIDAWHNQAAE